MITIKGAVHHLLGPLQPAEHDVPQFAQLYIIDSMDAQVTARLVALGVATPLWAKCEGEATLPKVGSWSPPGLPKTQSASAGVLQDSRKLRAQVQGSNLLAFERSWCHWKGLEV
jgi:hypothetical protein